MSLPIEKKLARKVAAAIEDYDLIAEGDRIMVGLSGGKDSWTLLHLLERARRVAPIDFEIVGFHLDQGFEGAPTQQIAEYCADHGFRCVVERVDTASIVEAKLRAGEAACSLCSRLRRGIIYSRAVDLGADKIALGHHRDDIVETLLMNIFFSGQLKAMPAKLFSDDGRNTLIRPLAYCPEAWIVEYAQQMGFPLSPCDLCDGKSGLERNEMRKLLDELSARNPNVRGSAFTAMSRVVTTHLYDRSLHDNAPRTSAPTTSDELQAELRT